ncbi:MAG: hypothetical protein IJL74_02730 [Bacilli bacterium]|nr:hypothetical protein [Bacilli bacterium]
MKKNEMVLVIIIVLLLSGCVFDPYRKPKYGEMVVDAWFSNRILGESRKKAENIDEIVSRECKYLESKDNKYVFSCKIVYKEKGETVIPLSKNTTINVYAVFIKEKDNKFDCKVYNSSSDNKIWERDSELNY